MQLLMERINFKFLFKFVSVIVWVAMMIILMMMMMMMMILLYIHQLYQPPTCQKRIQNWRFFSVLFFNFGWIFLLKTNIDFCIFEFQQFETNTQMSNNRPTLVFVPQIITNLIGQGICGLWNVTEIEILRLTFLEISLRNTQWSQYSKYLINKILHQQYYLDSSDHFEL